MHTVHSPQPALQAGGDAVRDGQQQLADEHAPRAVVRLATSPARRRGRLAPRRVGCACPARVFDVDRDAHAPLVRRHGGRHDLGHPHVALERRDLLRLVGCHGDARQQLRRGAGEGGGLTERWQYVLDVAQEVLVGADEQHAGPTQPLAVRVEQVRHPVQRDDGLPRPRPAFDHQRAVHRRADDGVLPRLDRRDDVLHPPRPRRRDSPEQRGVAGQRLVVGVPGRLQQLVVDRRDGATAHGDAPSHQDAVRIQRCRGVERRRDRRPPVDEQALAVLAGKPDATDVVALALLHLQPAEAQPGVGVAEAHQPSGPHLGERVALASPLRGPGRTGSEGPTQPRLRALCQLVQSDVHQIHARLLNRNL